jgi:tRNA(Ile)-lysidine synthase
LTLLDRVRHTIERHRLLVPGQTVVVGVSGGPDSLSLLHILRRLAPDFSLTLHVAHLNHQMRGEEAAADAAFVAGLAVEWGLPSTVDSVDVSAVARAHKMAWEEAARRARYAFLAAVADEVGADSVAAGHNADDQAETVLMHFLRGSGLAGLRGMLPATPMEELRLEMDDWDAPQPSSLSRLASLTLVRPLLEVPRSDIEAYCQEHGLRPRFDRSNLDATFFRNRLRQELIPYLETYNPGIREVLRRTASVVAADYDLLRRQLHITWKVTLRDESAHALTFDLAGWRELPLALKRSTIREAIHRLRWTLRNIDFVHVEKAVAILTEGKTGDQATLPQGLVLTIGYDTFTVADEDHRDLPDLPRLQPGDVVPVAMPGVTRLPGSGWALEAELLSITAEIGGELATIGGWEAYLDAAVVGDAPKLRPRRAGDRFCPLGMGGRGKRLNEFMINEKIPADWRDRIPLLVNAEDRILWVCGWRPDERARVAEGTRRVVHLRFHRMG